MALRPLRPERSASASSATPAMWSVFYREAGICQSRGLILELERPHALIDGSVLPGPPDFIAFVYCNDNVSTMVENVMGIEI
jgi:hypothetical protein